jgi:hypothetical protein
MRWQIDFCTLYGYCMDWKETKIEIKLVVLFLNFKSTKVFKKDKWGVDWNTHFSNRHFSHVHYLGDIVMILFDLCAHIFVNYDSKFYVVDYIFVNYGSKFYVVDWSDIDLNKLNLWNNYDGQNDYDLDLRSLD